MTAEALAPDAVRERAEALLAEIETAVVGKRAVLELVLQGLLADGHVLIEDVPGVAKTLIARSFAAATGAAFARVQFTPDLLPSDLTGSSFFDQRSADLVFRPGPIFTNVLLADEVNRAPPKTQAALLEAMQERQVTTDDRTRPLPPPFLVIATQNPVEFEGTYPLPEAQLDRFLLRVAVGYPDATDEWELLRRRSEREAPEPALARVLDLDELRTMQSSVHAVHIDADLGHYIVELVRATREAEGVQVGASPRGGLALMQLARAGALLEGRSYTVPDDVKRVAVPALAHRLSLRPELWIQQDSAEAVVRRCLDALPTPPTRPVEA
jgi:MoxR-like ATPase